jgi:predicted PurR-regulated permease PerM
LSRAGFSSSDCRWPCSWRGPSPARCVTWSSSSFVAGLIALLLNPIVRGLGRAWIPRGFAVAIVYLSFAALVVAAGVALSTVVVDQTKSAANRVDNYFTEEHGQPPIT